MSDPRITVIVQAVPERPAWAETRRSIEDSDIATAYEVALQRPDLEPRDHFLNVLELAANAPTDWVLRLEDDVAVNRHILHNLWTWPALQDPRFGAGWLFDAGGTTRTVHDRMYQRVGTDRWHRGKLHCCQGVLLRRSDAAVLRERCSEWFGRVPGRLSQDLALSESVTALGKEICIHAPPLVEHLVEYPSTLGNPRMRWHTTEGAFKRDWRR
jgi:hypothetical protein